jgi:hypothetical protein
MFPAKYVHFCYEFSTTFMYDLPLHQQRTMFPQQDCALPHFTLAFLYKASQQTVIWIMTSSLVACSYQHVVEIIIFEYLSYKIQLWPALVQKEDSYKEREQV